MEYLPERYKKRVIELNSIKLYVNLLKKLIVSFTGMFIDNLVDVAKKELAWEVDYVREAECTRKFKELLAPYPEYYVPEVIGKLYSLLNNVRR